ncbi:MAG: hypothetical protein RIE73_21180 [Coleofasciculus sp. C1-SOL-03]|uniref:hypothetical protein n=1 Tax=Coleofasciculus sp. C1-SOL-03 TaxID=3069522 RepID=UPI0032F0D079
MEYLRYRWRQGRRQKAEGRRQKAEGRKEKIDWSRFGAFCFVLIALATAIIQG